MTTEEVVALVRLIARLTNAITELENRNAELQARLDKTATAPTES